MGFFEELDHYEHYFVLSPKNYEMIDITSIYGTKHVHRWLVVSSGSKDQGPSMLSSATLANI